MTRLLFGRCAVAIVVGGAIAVAGCDPSTGGHAVRSAADISRSSKAAPSREPPSTTPSRPATPSKTPASKPPLKPSVKPPAPPAAADGSNVASCADAQCEVTVGAGTSIPVPSSTAVGDLRVDRVQNGKVVLSGQVIGDSSSGTCTGRDCDLEGTNNGFTITMSANSQATENGLAVAAEHISGDIVTLKIAPA